jgi:uncharacterized membrane protein
MAHEEKRLRTVSNSDFLFRDNFPRAALIGAVLLTVYLSYNYLGSRSLWFDEAFSVECARLSWSDLLSIIAEREANGGLYFLLLKSWVSLFGSSEIAARSLSIVFAAGTVPLIYLIGRRLFTARVGITAAWLIAVNPYFIRYAQEARTYSLVLLLVSVSSYFFLRCIEEPSGKNWTAYTLATIFSAYCHFFAFLIPLAHVVSLLFFPSRKDIRWRPLLVSATLYSLAVLPLIAFIATHDSGQVDWIPPFDVFSLPRLFYAFSGLVDFPAVLTYLLLFPFGLVQLFRIYCMTPRNNTGWHAAVTLLWLFLPIGAIVLVSLLKPMFVTRYFMVSFAPFIVISSLGLSSLSRKWSYRLCTSVVVILSINAVYTSYHASRGADWRSATSFVFSASQSSDSLVVFNDYKRIPFDYYWEKLARRRAHSISIYPSSSRMDLLMSFDTTISKGFLEHFLAAKKDRLWLILCNDNPKRLEGYISFFGLGLRTIPLSGERAERPDAESFRYAIESHYRFNQEWDFERIRVFLFSDKQVR